MDNNPNTTNENQAPVIPDDELKMPEEDFGAPRSETGRTSALVPLLAGLFIALLAAFAVLFFFGDTLMGALGVGANEDAATEETMDEPDDTETEAPPDTSEIDQIEAELEATSFSEFDAALSEIDAEIDSSATTTAE